MRITERIRAKYRQVNGTHYPSPHTFDILAEVSDFLAGKDLGVFPGVAQSLVADVRNRSLDRDSRRDAALLLAAWSIGRIEKIDKGEFLVD